MITIEQLAKVFPRASGEILDLVLWSIGELGLVTDHQIAAYLAQLHVESIGLTTLREIGGEKKSYAPWFGRGYIQTTHKRNYERVRDVTGIDCINHPELLEEPDGAIRAAIVYWRDCGLARLNDIDAVSRGVNGKHATEASLAARRSHYERALRAIRG